MKPRISSRPFVAALLVLGLMVVVAACGGSTRQQTQSSPSSSSSQSTPAAASSGSAVQGPTASGAPGAIDVVASDEGGQFRFDPAALEVRAGQQVSIHFVNKGTSAHDFSLPELGVETGLVDPGQEKTITFTAPSKPGEYRFVCTVPGHEQLGMHGKLVVH